MTKGLDDRELEGLSDEELAALEDEDVGSLADAQRAAKAAELPDDGDKGADADGEDEGEGEDADAGDEAADAAAAAGADADAGADAGKPDDAGEADDEADEPEPGMRLAPPDIAGIDDQLAKLLDDRKAIRAKYREGDITAEEKDEQEDAINDQIADLRAAKQNAAYVENFNNQAAEREHIAAVRAVKSEVLERDGIDYDKNPLLWQRWDLKVRELANDPANAQRTSRWFLEQAHKGVMAEIEAEAQALGFKRADGGKPRTDAEKVRDAVKQRRPKDTGAKSLATLPLAAQDTGRNDGEFAHLDRLEGDDLEMAVARMSPEQQERWARQ